MSREAFRDWWNYFNCRLMSREQIIEAAFNAGRASAAPEVEPELVKAAEDVVNSWYANNEGTRDESIDRLRAALDKATR